MTALSPTDWQQYHSPKLTLSIITNTRPQSLSRLFNSLQNAHYFGDTSISLRINLDQPADTFTRSLVSSFAQAWSHGPVFIHYRVVQAGLLPAVLESWYPSSDDEYALLLEDDVELSPLFYIWVKLSLLKYRLEPSLFGISLYQPKNVELHMDGRKPFDPMDVLPKDHPKNAPYLSQIPCSWGAVYFPKHWKEFHDFMMLRLSELSQSSTSASHPQQEAQSVTPAPFLSLSTPIVPSIRSNKWTKSWKKYFIELAYLRGYAMLYPNFPDYLSFSTNHHEPGVHVRPASSWSNSSSQSSTSSSNSSVRGLALLDRNSFSPDIDIVNTDLKLDTRDSKSEPQPQPYSDRLKQEFTVPLFTTTSPSHLRYLSLAPSLPLSSFLTPQNQQQQQSRERSYQDYPLKFTRFDLFSRRQRDWDQDWDTDALSPPQTQAESQSRYVDLNPNSPPLFPPLPSLPVLNLTGSLVPGGLGSVVELGWRRRREVVREWCDVGQGEDVSTYKDGEDKQRGEGTEFDAFGLFCVV
ncbi:hypothetical protein K435DRAFT_326494 [Dendrothele bispora CBS 962.96]|uniref:Glycosyltransferase family 2 protein n=1 Tax=Dendrothele bispora (strain CBS 962.96) TaxID=1314807 RepID=A0A4S8LG74_DENBC|nr:hypothetical protein K435DRAFT_326494 [Dendrothele bispora CBS 962.96]